MLNHTHSLLELEFVSPTDSGSFCVTFSFTENSINMPMIAELLMTATKITVPNINHKILLFVFFWNFPIFIRILPRNPIQFMHLLITEEKISLMSAL